MRDRKLVHLFFLVILAILVSFTNGYAAAFTEPVAPRPDKPLDVDREAKVNEILTLPAEAAFERLQDIDFFVDEELLQRAIFQRFKENRKEAIEPVLRILGYPVTETIGGEIVDRSRSFYIARKIMQTFPQQSTARIMELYRKGNPIVKGNLIMLSGRMAAGPDLVKLLKDALKDKAVYEATNELMEGEPLRICDLAYNQLVLRYKIKRVLRSIGTVHAIEDRDTAIAELKTALSI